MGKNWFILKLRLFFLLLLCFVACNNSKAKVDLKTESLKIYSLLIYQFYIDYEDEPVVINSFSCDCRINVFYFNLQFEKHSKIDWETLEDFKMKNRVVSMIANDFPFDSGYRFLAYSGDEDSKKSDRKYKNFINRVKKIRPYSGRKIITFSKVGFNKNGSQAIVEFDIRGWFLPNFLIGGVPYEEGSYVIGGTVFLDKTLGPSPHVWAIKDWEKGSTIFH
ncbi:MAG: hypothetical protein MIO92_07775 [Methanosarcinaceae archaeon]|nr:hypothetical protein [Methanosarcinaceae archaeon]